MSDFKVEQVNIVNGKTKSLTGQEHTLNWASALLVYDSGGPEGYYGNNEEITHTFNNVAGESYKIII